MQSYLDLASLRTVSPNVPIADYFNKCVGLSWEHRAVFYAIRSGDGTTRRGLPFITKLCRVTGLRKHRIDEILNDLQLILKDAICDYYN